MRSFDDNLVFLADISDENLALMSQKGNKKAEEILFERYRNFVKIKSRSYFLVGADKEDIIQEGMIGLFKSIRDYNPNKSTSFKSFAEICIQRQILTAIKTASRQKHNPLNTYISLDMPLYDEESEKTLLDSIPNTDDLEPETILINQEELLNIEDKILQMLSDLEWKVLINYVNGKTYYEIAEDLQKQVKCIDNALQRVKKKLMACLNKEITEI